MARVVVLGSSNTDMTVRLPWLPQPGETVTGGTFHTGPGGKGANQAIAARRAGAEVVFVTAVGDDPMGRAALEGYRAEGLDLSFVKVVPNVASGVALIFVGDRTNMIAVAPGANAELDPDTVEGLPNSLFAAGDVLLAGLEIPLETVDRAIRRARAAGMRTILNPAPMHAGLRESDLFPFVDVLTPNEVEARVLAGSALGDRDSVLDGLARALHSRGAGSLVVTVGEQGCQVFERSRPPRQIPAFPAEAVDTVGAGDAFNGALAAALAEGRPLHDAAVWATAAASLAVRRAGAQAALPDRSEIDRLAAGTLAH